MTKTGTAMAAAGLVLAMTGAALADGMIVPVRPDIRVRGSWAVKYHHVSVKVRDQVASVAIDQEFVNTGRGMIEVEYMFPIPPGAAIDSMTLVVDGKEFAARLLKADEARKIYEGIVRRKKDPALLEYVGFGMYKTRAFPLVPGKPCKVLVTYKNVCKKDRDLVEVWYPLNTEKFSAKAIESVRVTVDIKSKMDIGPVYSPTHDLHVERKDNRHVIATYKAKEALPTSDFQCFYKAGNEKVGATLLTQQAAGGKDGHFMLLVSPNPRAAKQHFVAKDVVVVFDHSGSMSGEKLKQAKGALEYVLKNLNGEDRFNVVAYNDGVDAFYSGLVEARKAKVADAMDILDRIEATGGTNIHGALGRAMEIVSSTRKSKRPAYVIFLTDGEPTTGNTNEKDILDDTKKANSANARIFAFGVGYQPNVRLLDRLVGQNGGRSDYVKPKEPIEAKVSSLYNKIKNPVMTNLKMTLRGVRLRDLYPRDLGDLFDGDQIVVAGRYDCKDARKLPAAEGGMRQSTLVIKGTYQGKDRAFEYNVALRPVGKDLRFAFVEKIWAIRRVGYLMDQIQLHGKSQEVIDELVRLSKAYGIMTPYTSFLADETTPLAKPAEVRRHAAKLAKGLAAATAGESAQRGAKMRQSLNLARRAPAASAPGGWGDGRGQGKDGKGGVVMYGNTRKESYERDKVEYVAGVRNVGNTSLYRRGRVWVAAKATKLDIQKDKKKITVINRFSEKYFDLVRRNSVQENQVFSSQRADEELMMTLRGKTYLIK